jgi:hypothetical protein
VSANYTETSGAWAFDVVVNFDGDGDVDGDDLL